jgi:hypothetical protein
MSEWLQGLRRNWDVILAFSLVFIVIGMYLGPGYFFLTWYVLGSAYIIRVALKR